MGVGGPELEARRTQRLQTAELLKGRRTPLHIIESANHATKMADRAIDEALAREPPRPPLACREGCAWCCHKVVGTAAPEVFRIVAYLREHLGESATQELVARTEAYVAQRRALAEDHWVADRLPCPLLVENRCTVYPVRPLTCRGFTSSNARRCERAAKVREPTTVPTHGPALRTATYILDGMRSGLAEAGLAGDLLRLGEALRIAMMVPDVFERWLAGESVFAAARLQ
jgi:Fe-S-cluster containining protein